MIIAADMFLTVVVMVMVYKCAKKRSSAALPRVPKGTIVPKGPHIYSGLVMITDSIKTFTFVNEFSVLVF